MNNFSDFFTKVYPETTSSNKEPGIIEFFFNQDLKGEPARGDGTSPNCAQVFDERFVFWALRNLPIEEAVKNFLICGMVGSGKTIGIQLFLQSIAPRFKLGREKPEQLIIFDAKSDVIPTLAALGLTPDAPNVYILNPFDERSMIWDIGEAVQEPALARGFATLLVPEEVKSSAPFFASAARDLVNAVILALNESRGTNWKFRDLLCALDSKSNIKRVTSRHERPKRMVAQLLNDKQHCHGVLATLSTKLSPFHQTAALWNSNTNSDVKKFSIDKFLKEPGVLILGNDPVLRDSLWPINAAMLRALTAAILRGKNTLQPRHWFVLDEFRAMQKVDAMHDLLNRGRGKGASVVLGIQSIEGLMEVYQENGTHDILSQCTSKSFLRSGGPKTAQWASDVIGSVRRNENSTTHTSGKEPSDSVQTSLKDRPQLLPSFFLDIPFPGVGKPYTVVSDVPADNTTHITTRPFDTVLNWLVKGGDEIEAKHPSVIPRKNVSDQTLKPWSKEESRLFCGPPTKESKKKSSGSSPKKEPSKPTKKAPQMPKRRDRSKPSEGNGEPEADEATGKKTAKAKKPKKVPPISDSINMDLW